MRVKFFHGACGRFCRGRPRRQGPRRAGRTRFTWCRAGKQAFCRLVARCGGLPQVIEHADAVAKAFISHRPVIIGVCVLRVDLNCAIEIGHGPGAVACPSVGRAPVAIDMGVPRIDLKGTTVIADGPLIITRQGTRSPPYCSRPSRIEG